MSGLRIWHILVAVVAVAVLFAMVRFDDEYNSSSPLTPLLGISYLCGLIGFFVARVRGRRGRTGLYLGLLLGPVGVLIAGSNPLPEGWNKHEGQRLGAESDRCSDRKRAGDGGPSSMGPSSGTDPSGGTRHGPVQSSSSNPGTLS